MKSNIITKFHASIDDVTRELRRKEKVIRTLQKQLYESKKSIKILQKTSIRRFKIRQLKGFYLDFNLLSCPKEDIEINVNDFDEGKHVADRNSNISEQDIFDDEKFPKMENFVESDVIDLRPRINGMLVQGPFF